MPGMASGRGMGPAPAPSVPGAGRGRGAAPGPGARGPPPPPRDNVAPANRNQHRKTGTLLHSGCNVMCSAGTLTGMLDEIAFYVTFHDLVVGKDAIELSQYYINTNVVTQIYTDLV